MAIDNAGDLQQLKHERDPHYSRAHSVMDELLAVRDGEVPARYQDYFPVGIPVQMVNMIRMAHDDHTAMAGKVFPLYVPPKKSGPKALRDAEKVEQINYGYNEAASRMGGMSMDGLMKKLAWWLSLCGDAVMMVLPSDAYQTPFFTFRDPRTHLPPVGWGPWSQTPLRRTLFTYKLRLGELQARFPHAAAELARKHTKRILDSYGRAIAIDDNPEVWVGEYYDDDCWMVATLEEDGVTLMRSDQGDRGHPGVTPVVPMTMFSATDPKGRPLFADQVPLQMVLARIIAQKVDYTDKMIYPEIYSTPLQDDVRKYGPGSLNIFDTAAPGGERPYLQVVSPQGTPHADAMLGFLMGASRMLNRDPESLQGAGDANSAKAIEALRAGVHMTIQDGLWPVMIDALPRAYTAAMEMDIAMWGSVRKSASGKRRNSRFTVDYIPTFLQGWTTSVTVEPGLGLAGYQGKLEIMQMLGAGLISRSTALEAIPEFQEPRAEKRRIDADKLEEVIFQDLATKAASGMLAPGALAEIKRLIEEEDIDLGEAITKLQEAGALEPPPPPTAPGGDIAGLAAALGGGGPAEAITGGVPPSLGQIRGRP